MSRIIEFNPEKERPYIVQMFGKNPEAFAEAAKLLKISEPMELILTMGVRQKVIGSGHGSDLIRNPCSSRNCFGGEEGSSYSRIGQNSSWLGRF